MLTPEDVAARLGSIPDGLPRYRVTKKDIRFKPEEIEAWEAGVRHFPDPPGYVRPPEPEPEPVPLIEFAQHAAWMRKPGFVYCIADDDESPVKIGWTTSAAGLTKRLGGIQVGCWLPLRVHAVLEGQRWEEKQIHQELAEHHIRGEWFERGPALEYVTLHEWPTEISLSLPSGNDGKEKA